MELRPSSVILHVEENAINRSMVSRVLRRAGFTVVEATTRQSTTRHPSGIGGD